MTYNESERELMLKMRGIKMSFN